MFKVQKQMVASNFATFAELIDFLSSQRACLYNKDKRCFSHLLNFMSIEEFLISKDKVLSYEGRLNIVVNNIILKCFVSFKERSQSLLVFFNGARSKKCDLKNYQPTFARASYKNMLESNIICIDDPMYDNYPELLLGWFYGNKTNCYLYNVNQLISAIKEAFNINELIYFGSSGGGFGSLYASSQIKNVLSISINPQLYPYEWDKEFGSHFSLITGLDFGEIDPFCRNTIEKLVLNDGSKHVIIVNAYSFHDLTKQLLVFSKKLNLSLHYGCNLYKNIMIWVYDCIGVSDVRASHNSVDYDFLFPFIIDVSKDFYNGKDEDYINNKVIPFNEYWSRYYLLKKELYDYTFHSEKRIIYDQTNSLVNSDSLGICFDQLFNIHLDAIDFGYNCFKYDKLEPYSYFRFEIIDLKVQNCFMNNQSKQIENLTLGVYDFEHCKRVLFVDLKIQQTMQFNFITSSNVNSLAFLVYAGCCKYTHYNSLDIKKLKIYKKKMNLVQN